jgi:hypothetical protein
MGRWGLVFAILAACGGDDGSGAGTDAPTGSNSGEPANLAGILAAHNTVRAMVQTSPELAPLTWNADLAATAAAWVAKCTDTDHNGLVDHNDGRSDGHPYYVGENIYASSGTASGPDAVTSWAAESAHYTYSTNTCNGVCGHYTQIVWRDTLEVGCALGTCAGLQFPSTIVCDYGPGGNISNQKPY